MKYDERFPYRLADAYGERWDWSPGDVISADVDGTIVLDDGITTFNPQRAQRYFVDSGDEASARALEQNFPEVAHGEAPDVDGNEDLDFYPEWLGARRRAKIAKDAAQLVEATRAAGGGTFDSLSLEPVDMTTGYFVSREGGIDVAEENFDDGLVRGWLANVKQSAGDFIGTWIEEGRVYLDSTRWFKDRDEAFAFGAANKQQAVWDVAAGEAVYIEQEEVATAKVAATVQYALPPQGIHFRTHAAMKKAGLTATVTYPGGVSSDFPEGLVSQVPGPTAMDEMGYSMDAEMAGVDLESIEVQVDAEDLEAVIAIFDQQGGRQSAEPSEAPAPVEGKTAGDNEHTDVSIKQEDKEALQCPNCGSHTLRAFDVAGGSAELKCLTCGNEFSRPAMMNPEAKVANDGKFGPGTRITVEHPSHKGQRGSIVRFKGKHKDLEEEEYEVLLDSGDKLESLPESAFSKIKSAAWSPPDTPGGFFLGSMEVEAFGTPYAEEEPEWNAPGGPPFDEPQQPMYPLDEEDSFEVANCPACDGPGMLLGQLASRLHYRCRNCGLDFSTKSDSPDPMLSKVEASDWKDSTGEALKPGSWYRMHHGEYTVPDSIKVLNLESRGIEAEIQNGPDSTFPLVIESAEGYSFEPMSEEDFNAEKTAASASDSGWQIVARKNWSPAEQRALINENPDGRARNFEKLDLSGTHYETRTTASDNPDFLWGV